MILRRVTSGDIKLTPRLLQVLKELEHDQSDTGAPNHVSASVTPQMISHHAARGGEQ
jgi:hypothetical protein